MTKCSLKLFLKRRELNQLASHFYFIETDSKRQYAEILLPFKHGHLCSFLLTQLQGDIGKRAPTYLKDLIGRLASFSDEPRLAGLVGLVVTMVMDMAYSSSKQSSGVKGKSAGSSSCQVKPLIENNEGNK